MSSWATPPTVIAGTTILAATWNAGARDLLNVLRSLTGGDPAGGNLALISIDGSSANWIQVPTAAIADGAVTTAKVGDAQITAAKLGTNAAATNIGYFPANKAGDTFTGPILVVQGAGSGGSLTGLTINQTSGGAGGSALIHQVVGAAGAYTGPIFGSWSWALLDSTASTVLMGVDTSGVLKSTTHTVWHSGNLDPTSLIVGSADFATNAGLLNSHADTYFLARANHTGTQLAATISDLATAVALLTAASANAIADGAVSTTAKLANLVVTAAKMANSTITDTQVATANKDGVAGTASMRTLGTSSTQASAGNHTHAAGDATTLDGIDSTSFARVDAATDFATAPTINSDAITKIKSGTFSGTSTTNAITGVGFAPKQIDIMDDAGAFYGVIINGIVGGFASGSVAAFQTVTMGADGWTFGSNPGAGANVTGHSYHYVAYG